MMRLVSVRKVRGFSLIELVLVMVLLGSIAGMMAIPMASLVDSQRQLANASVQKTDVDYTIGRMTSAIRAASEVTVCTADTLTMTVNGTSFSFSLLDDAIVLDDTETLLTSVGVDTTLCDSTYASVLDVYRISISVDGQTYSASAFRRIPTA